MTKRKRALRFRGNRTASIHVGQAMGPGTDNLYRRVTSVTYDRRHKQTVVEVEVVELAGEGERLRFHGRADGADQLPPERLPIHEEITPQ